MDLSVHNEIYDIFCKVSNEPQYRHIWVEYNNTYHRLYAWIDSLPDRERLLIDDHLQAFFDMHIQMMEIALREYHK